MESLKLSEGDNQLCQKWVQYTQWIVHVRPGLEYFADAVSGPLANSMKAFKVASFFNPKKTMGMKPGGDETRCSCTG